MGSSCDRVGTIMYILELTSSPRTAFSTACRKSVNLPFIQPGYCTEDLIRAGAPWRVCAPPPRAAASERARSPQKHNLASQLPNRVAASATDTHTNRATSRPLAHRQHSGLSPAGTDTDTGHVLTHCDCLTRRGRSLAGGPRLSTRQLRVRTVVCYILKTCLDIA